MLKKLICIECPRGCKLIVETNDQGQVINVRGNECTKGDKYGRTEIENPVRILTSSVLTEGLVLKMLPVRTSAPIPRARVQEAIQEIKKICVKTSVKAGDLIVKNFLDLGIDLIATRDLGQR